MTLHIDNGIRSASEDPEWFPKEINNLEIKKVLQRFHEPGVPGRRMSVHPKRRCQRGSRSFDTWTVLSASCHHTFVPECVGRISSQEELGGRTLNITATMFEGGRGVRADVVI